jgi:tetratricopeptide (TPR) repeat protein
VTPSRRSGRSALTERPADAALVAAHTTGLRFWLPAVAVLIGAVVLIPVLWVLLAHWLGLSLSAAGTTSSLLAIVGGVMGAIFTVGGLVIALVSVYTQLSIENRIRRSFEALLPELDERAQAHIEAYIAFTQATEEHNWRRAQELADEALEKWPALRGVRRVLAEKMSREVAQWFFLREVEHARLGPVPGLVTSGREGFGLREGMVSIYGPSMAAPNPALYVSREDIPLIEAINELADAIAHGEDTDEELRALLALMYGVAGRYDDMLRCVKMAVEHNEGLMPYFQESWQLALLANGCALRNLEVRLKDLGSIIGKALPAARAEVLASLQAVDMSPGTYYWNVYWIAFEKPVPANPGRAAALGMVHIQLGGTSDARTGVARWLSGRTSQMEVIPSAGSSVGRQIDIQRLVNELDAKFMFICQHDVGWHPQA